MMETQFQALPSRPEYALALLALAPALVAWLLSLIPSRITDERGIQAGVPPGTAPADDDAPLIGPLVKHCRTQSARDLRDVAVGLRHLPVEHAAPVLKHLMRNADPELSLYAQSMLQQNRETLQGRLARLSSAAGKSGPRAIATELETALRLASPQLMSEGERGGAMARLLERARAVVAAGSLTPRVACACARIFLEARQPDLGLRVIQSLDPASPQRRDLERRLRFAITRAASAAPASAAAASASI